MIDRLLPRTLVALCCAICGYICALPAAEAQTRQKIVLASVFTQNENYLATALQLIWREAFRQLDIEVNIETFPPLRGSMEADAGMVDGELARAREYGDKHPNLIRVEESSMLVTASAYTTDPGLQIKSWADLGDHAYRVEYRLGYAVIKARLEGVVPKDNLSATSNSEQGLKKLALGRSDIYVDIEEYVLPVLAREKFRTNGIRRAGRLESAVLYLYLHKKNAALVPRLTAIMHQMKTSGQLDQLKMRAREIDNIAANASAPVR
jgi:hypothetical protein